MRHMVSSGQINSDLSSIKSYLSNYDNFIGELGSSWKGASYDNLVAKANEFSSEFASSITSQMTSFATACDLYEKYKATKTSIATARSNYNNAVFAKNNKNASSYSAEISRLESELTNLKGQIESALSAVTGIKLDATSTTTTTPITTTASSSSGNTSVALDSAGNLANPNIIHSGRAHTDGLAPAMKVRVDKLATRYYELTGNKLKINSGSRTMDEQRSLYNSHGSSRAASPNPNAPHVAGMAVDIDTSQANWLAKNGVLEECGLCRPLLNWGSKGGTDEPWHIEIEEWRKNGRATEYVRSLTA